MAMASVRNDESLARVLTVQQERVYPAYDGASPMGGRKICHSRGIRVLSSPSSGLWYD